MKLLFDENLSRRLKDLLGDVFPESKHVSELGLLSGSDAAIWNRARDESFVIVTKDADFHTLSLVLGAPPKVLWLRCGNLGTAAIADLLRQNSATVTKALEGSEFAYFVLYA